MYIHCCDIYITTVINVTTVNIHLSIYSLLIFIIVNVSKNNLTLTLDNFINYDIPKCKILCYN